MGSRAGRSSAPIPTTDQLIEWHCCLGTDLHARRPAAAASAARAAPLLPLGPPVLAVGAAAAASVCELDAQAGERDEPKVQPGANAAAAAAAGGRQQEAICGCVPDRLSGCRHRKKGQRRSRIYPATRQPPNTTRPSPSHV